MVFGVLNIGVIFSRLLLLQRRQEEGVKNECVVFVMKKPISKKKIAERTWTHTRRRGRQKEKGACNRHPLPLLDWNFSLLRSLDYSSSLAASS